MLVLLKSLGVGLGVGLVFGLVRLPIPAPPAFAGVLGIFGIYLGYLVARRLFW